jgi:hypothetical protein
MTLDANGDGKSASNLPSLGNDGPIVRLQLGGERISFDVTAGGGAAPVTLDVGSMERLCGILAHEPATAQEIETAIAEIEDMLTPAIRTLPKGAELVTSASGFQALRQVLALSHVGNAQVEVSMVEDVFGRLAAVAYGTPANQMKIPESRSFAAAVLVLRELMHHAGFPSVRLT